MSRRLDDVRLAVMMLDGLEIAQRTHVVALGITSGGVKIPLGLWEGSIESYFPLHQDLIEFIVTEFPETLTGPARQAMGIDAPNKNFDTGAGGRATYEIGLAVGTANAEPHLRHIVFSTTMRQSPDPTVQPVAADPSQTARRLKAEDGPGHLDRRRGQAGSLSAARDRPLDPQAERIGDRVRHPNVRRPIQPH